MTGTLYAMITTRSSNHYTAIALETFFKSTKLTAYDEFILIDNDNEGTYAGVNAISNPRPKSFAENCNLMLDYANGRNFCLVSNDVAFTPKWNEPLTQFSNVITIPSCNQTHLYTAGDLQLQPSMRVEEYTGRYNELSQIAQLHKAQTRPGFFERLLMGFYVFMIPANVYKKIGYFDERFGVGGGEDVDYRLRALQQGISVKYISQSYLLHFAGKSSWDGPEKQLEIDERNAKYFSQFAEKWGEDLANLCLAGGNAGLVIEKYQLYSYLQNQDYTAAIKAVLNITHRN
jgi:GT2 family glycosyltransferase